MGDLAPATEQDNRERNEVFLGLAHTNRDLNDCHSLSFASRRTLKQGLSIIQQ
jgi:hypothetical protein